MLRYNLASIKLVNCFSVNGVSQIYNSHMKWYSKLFYGKLNVIVRFIERGQQKHGKWKFS